MATTKTAKTAAPKSAADRVAEQLTEADVLLIRTQLQLIRLRAELSKRGAACSWGDVGDMTRVLAALTEAHRVLTNGEG